jgi:AAA family ATP:ADP antiporter
MGLRRDDRRNLIIGFLTLMMVMVAHALGETARDSLFLAGLGANDLPWAYLTIAALALVVVRGNQWMLDRVRDKRKLLMKTMFIAALVDVGFWLWLEGSPHGRAFALYVWIGLFATITVVQVWLLLDDVVDVAQAKRIFGPIAAGSVFGALLGSGLAERLIEFGLAPRHLMLAAGVTLAAGAFVPLLWRPGELEPHAPSHPTTNILHNLETLLGHEYLRRLLLLVLLSTLAFTGADFVFKSAVERHVPEEELASFFARFYVVLNAVALVVQLFVVSRLLRYVGVNRTLYVLPVLLLAGTLGFLAMPGLIPAILLKGADGSLRHSLHRTASEVLYLPVSRELRERFKTIIDGVGQRGGQAIASVGILLAVYLGADLSVVAIFVCGLVMAWVAVLAGLRKPYLALFRESLRGGADMASPRMELDQHSLEALIAALNSDHDEEVLVAIELFEHHDRVDLLPKLVLYHPSTAVALRALECFIAAEDHDFVPIARRLIRDGTPEVRAGALRAIAAVEPAPALLEASLDDDSAAVRATALVGMLSDELGDPEDLERRLSLAVLQGSDEVKVELARAVRYSGDRRFEELIEKLLADGSGVVRAEAALAVAAIPSERFLSPLIDLLTQAEARPQARKAFLAIGAPALAFLERALRDTSLPRKVRRHLPRTVHRFDNQWALDILQAQLAEERDGAVRYKILRGLGRLRANDDRLRIDGSTIARLQRKTLERAVEMGHLCVRLEEGQRADARRRTVGGDLLVASLREKETNALERVFRMQHILRPQDSYQLYWRGLNSPDGRRRAASRELVEHAFGGATREAIRALTDDAPITLRVQAAAEALGMNLEKGSYEEALEGLIDDPSEAIRSLTAYHIAELGLTDLEARLKESAPAAESSVGQVVDRAIAALRGEVPSVA